jgi:predicted peptidase
MMKVPLSSFSADDRKFVLGLVHERDLDVSLTKGVYAENITGRFVKMVSKQGLNYQLFGNPKWDNKQRYPLVIWLHGSGSSGTDNTSQMGGATGVFTDSQHQSKNPCFMIAPQCPDAAIGWNKDVANNLMALIADLCDKLPVDANRLYLTGSSMGGFGSFSLAIKYPEVWAAVVPLCGGSDVKNADALKNIPLWAFHGDKDPMVPVERTRNVMKAIIDGGGKLAKYDELKGEGHGITGVVYSRADVHDWIFAQKRNAMKRE